MTHHDDSWGICLHKSQAKFCLLISTETENSHAFIKVFCLFFFFLNEEEHLPPDLKSRNHYFLTQATCLLLNTAQDKRKSVLGMTVELCVDQTYELSTCDAEFWNFCFPVSPCPINGQERCLLVWGTVTQKSSFHRIYWITKWRLKKPTTDQRKENKCPSALFQLAQRQIFPTIFDLVIILKNNPDRWELAGTPRWCSPSPGPGWSWPEGA